VSSFLANSVAYLKGIGPKKAEQLKKELNIATYEDLLFHYPFRYEDKTKVYAIKNITGTEGNIQLLGKVRQAQTIGEGRKKRLVAQFYDQTGTVELVWFNRIDWVRQYLRTSDAYLVFGKPAIFNGKISFNHPEIEIVEEVADTTAYLQPIYHTTEKMKRSFVDSKTLSKSIRLLAEKIDAQNIKENLPQGIVQDYGLVAKWKAIQQIHFPASWDELRAAEYRLKFEELFLIQLAMASEKKGRKATLKGLFFENIPTITTFYRDILPFDLTNAQKRVIKEIRVDLNSGIQMNRLLQGDVGSGKTIVAFITMLMALDNEAQACLMAPTEILSNQHYHGLKEYADMLGITIGLLTGSTKKKERNRLHEALLSGELNIIVGTHALLEDKVQFKNLGLCVIDEQHRFGVAQRARLWKKNKHVIPHILVMTATPIPRTLAMTVYGDLDVSVIDELPPGRKAIQTIHRFDSHRLKLLGFIAQEIEKGRQVYIVYPLIEESEKLDLKDLMDGYESIARRFAPPEYAISIVHGKMKPEDKDYEMQRFVQGKTQIMVATTVIEVGVNVPNASVMIIENAERFGLSQLHQLRGRVGRGAEQSYCILMTGHKLSKEAKIRLDAMCRTNNGFEIADVDLKLRGPGDMEGTRQSGVLDLKIADLGKDGAILQKARKAAFDLVDRDPQLSLPVNQALRNYLENIKKKKVDWGRIS